MNGNSPLFDYDYNNIIMTSVQCLKVPGMIDKLCYSIVSLISAIGYARILDYYLLQLNWLESSN